MKIKQLKLKRAKINIHENQIHLISSQERYSLHFLKERLRTGETREPMTTCSANKYTLFLQKAVRLDPRLAVFKIFLIFRVYCSDFIFIFHDFLKIFHNTVMIYNNRNRSNDTAVSQKEKKTCFNAYFQ